MKLENQHIIIVSNEPWGDVWFSKHHYANELAKLGNKVFFVNPVNKWKIKNLFSFKSEIVEISENLSVINYCNNFPIRLFPNLFQIVTDRMNIKKLWKHIPKDSSVIFWQFEIFRFLHIPKSKNLIRIYHAADVYLNHTRDRKIAEKADLIICTSESFISHYKTHKPTKKIIHIPHGISEDEFQPDSLSIDVIQQKYGDYVILTGSISSYIDIKLLYAVANNISINLIIAGRLADFSEQQQQDWNRLIELNNVSFVGAINGKQLKNWIAAAKICLVTYIFDLEKYDVNSTSSLKILNYLAQQKVIVSTIDGELPILKNKAIFTAKNEEEFIDFVQKGISGKLTTEKELVERFLHEQTYPILIHKIEQELELTTIE